MFPARRFAAAVTALLPVAGAFFVFLFPAADARAESPSGTCEDTAELAVLLSPIAPWKGAPLRILVAAEKPLDGELSLIAPDGTVAAKSRERHGGPPYSWFAEVATPAVGTWHATLVRDDAPAGCSAMTRDLVVSAQKPPGPHAPEGSMWQIRNTWNRATEDLYSAWIAKLFDAPLEAEPSWKAWHEVLRDRSRNVLFNYLGLGEDNVAMSLRPDCADFVYFLRAYFAFKMGLPFGYSNCSRGISGAPPKCYQWFDIQHPEVTRPAPPPEQTAASAAPAPNPEPAAAPTSPPHAVVFPAAACASRTSGDPACAAEAEAARACGVVRRIFAGRRRRRPFRIGANVRDRRQHRFLYRPADTADLAPGDRVRRSVRACSDAGAARAGVRRRRRRLPRRRRGARWVSHAQAFLARQFPLRA